MSDAFKVRATSSSTAKVEDVWLAEPEDPGSVLTRKVARSELVDNAHSDEARVKVTIVHQKRHKNKEPWQDYETFNMATMTAGQEMKCALTAFETFDLFKFLQRLHTITDGGIPKNDGKLAVVDVSRAVVVRGRAAELIRQMTDEASDEFWEAIQQLQPNLFRVVAMNKLHELRENAVKEFEQHMAAGDWNEPAWQAFFENNTWIFGYGLTYSFLSTITAQPQYGGTLVTGSGGQRGDFLTAAEAEQRFSVLVEIKRPDSVLVQDKLYRNKVHMLGEELTGGISQLQSNCRTWETQGSRDDDNRELLESAACHTIQPKGVLIIGHTKQLATNAKRTTFELARRNLQNPEVITFDELLNRAKHLLLNEAKEIKPSPDAEDGPPETDEIPEYADQWDEPFSDGY